MDVEGVGGYSPVPPEVPAPPPAPEPAPPEPPPASGAEAAPPTLATLATAAILTSTRNKRAPRATTTRWIVMQRNPASRNQGHYDKVPFKPSCEIHDISTV